MKRLPVILILLSMIASCIKEEGVDYTIMHQPDEGCLVSQYGAYMTFTSNPDTATLVEPYKAIIEGSFSYIGTDDTIQSYGHVWSSSNTYPTLGDSASAKYDALSSGEAFTSTVRNLKILTDYYVRSYVVTKEGAIGYSPYVYQFTTTSDTNLWILKTSTIASRGRYGAVCFTIGDSAYMGTGNDGLSPLKDFWKYDANEETWTQVAELTGAARQSAAAFAIGNYGYVTTGENTILSDEDVLRDCYRYNAEDNYWEKLGNAFSGPRIKNAVAFSLEDKGYIGLGDLNDSPIDNFYEYDPSMEENSTPWTSITAFPGGERTKAIVFTIESNNTSIAFVGLGENEDGDFQNDIWPFYGESTSWSSSITFPGDARIHAVAFGVDDEGYITTGMMNDSTHLNDLWKYDIAHNTWTRKADFTGGTRRQAVGFSLITRGYVATGISRDGDYKNDLYEYLLDSVRTE